MSHRFVDGSCVVPKVHETARERSDSLSRAFLRLPCWSKSIRPSRQGLGTDHPTPLYSNPRRLTSGGGVTPGLLGGLCTHFTCAQLDSFACSRLHKMKAEATRLSEGPTAPANGHSRGPPSTFITSPSKLQATFHGETIRTTASHRVRSFSHYCQTSCNSKQGHFHV